MSFSAGSIINVNILFTACQRTFVGEIEEYGMMLVFLTEVIENLVLENANQSFFYSWFAEELAGLTGGNGCSERFLK